MLCSQPFATFISRPAIVVICLIWLHCPLIDIFEPNSCRSRSEPFWLPIAPHTSSPALSGSEQCVGKGAGTPQRNLAREASVARHFISQGTFFGVSALSLLFSVCGVVR